MGFSVARPLIDDLRSPTPALGRILVVENSYSDRKRENSYLFPAFDRAENNFISSFNSPFLSLSLCNKYSNVVFVRFCWRAIHKVVKTIISFNVIFYPLFLQRSRCTDTSPRHEDSWATSRFFKYIYIYIKRAWCNMALKLAGSLILNDSPSYRLYLLQISSLPLSFPLSLPYPLLFLTFNLVFLRYY